LLYRFPYPLQANAEILSVTLTSHRNWWTSVFIRR